MTRWEHFPHDADVGIRGFGITLAQAFEQAACALTAVVTDLNTVAPKSAVTVECNAPDVELLLVDWLNALIFEMAARRMLFSRFEVEFDDTRLAATAWGEAIDVDRHRPTVEPKGATYTALAVTQNENGDWAAQCVIDV